MKKTILFIYCVICLSVGHTQMIIADHAMILPENSFKDGTTFSSPAISMFPAKPGCPCAVPSIDPLQKSKRQKTIALILLGTGGAMMVTSVIISRGELVHDGICIGYLCSDKYKNDDLKSTLLVAGAATALTSVPFFVIAGKNKRKTSGTSFILKMEDAHVLTQRTVITHRFPAAGAVFQLGK